MAASNEERLEARNDLAWAIAVGGIGVVLFVALLAFTWTFAATVFLAFAVPAWLAALVDGQQGSATDRGPSDRETSHIHAPGAMPQ